MLWGIVKSKTNRLPLTVLPPKREDRIQTYKHKYRAKSRRLQKSNMQVLKGKTNQILKKKKTCRELRGLQGNLSESPF